MNSHFGCFRESDLDLLAQLCVGRSMITGHRKDSLPFGKIYRALVEEHQVDGETVKMVFVRFYYPVGASYANDLRWRILSGIISELSISIVCEDFICSVCNRSMRDEVACRHIPGETVEGETVFYWYSGITDVVEGSFVVRGAHPNTGFSKVDQMKRDLSVSLSSAALDEWQPIFNKMKQGARLERRVVFEGRVLNREVVTNA